MSTGTKKSNCFIENEFCRLIIFENATHLKIVNDQCRKQFLGCRETKSTVEPMVKKTHLNGHLKKNILSNFHGLYV